MVVKRTCTWIRIHVSIYASPIIIRSNRCVMYNAHKTRWYKLKVLWGYTMNSMMLATSFVVAQLTFLTATWFKTNFGEPTKPKHPNYDGLIFATLILFTSINNPRHRGFPKLNGLNCHGQNHCEVSEVGSRVEKPTRTVFKIICHLKYTGWLIGNSHNGMIHNISQDNEHESTRFNPSLICRSRLQGPHP